MTTLQTGQQAPAFTLPDASDRPVSLADETAQAERGVIVYFYPKAATPGCTTEACDFRDTLGSLQAAGYRVLGVSPDEPEALRSFAADQALTFPLLSDADGAVAEAYGTRGEKTIEGTPRTITRRSTFVVDRQGVLTHAEYDVDAQGHVAALRETLGA
ncbi:peroxiredoxin [Nesterenkonia halobia]|uniref:thioredoxin-dependent peroxiredoxin n=1 Tax=Nesterenkonia halobia TaxID=37922 RepID=A0ABP6RKE3_9MICC